MTEVLGISATRVPATDIKVGDQVALYHLTYFTVEWVRTDPESGSTLMAGLTNAGKPHTSHLSEHAKVSRIFDIKEEK